jgi:mannose-6-phosphate isomerase
MKPFRLKASAYEKIWGSRNLAPWFPPPDKAIGEVWFTGDPPLPILVKFLFTSDKLSVQVHPAGPRGKTEMWHILRADAGATIAVGFREPITRNRLREAALSGEIESLLNWIPVHAGQTYFTPAGTVHAIGAGVALCEVQQNCDITYRLYDYGRPRETHVEQAVAVADLGPHPGASPAEKCSEDCRLLAECQYFVTESLQLRQEMAYPRISTEFHLLICLAGSGRLAAEPFQPGEVWMVPRGSEPFTLTPDGIAHLLRTFVP